MTTIILLSIIVVSYLNYDFISNFFFGGKKLTPKEF